jgi:hypothetical protein
VVYESASRTSFIRRARHGGLRGAPARIKADILNGLNRHHLWLAGLAARRRVTPRYVQMLFVARAGSCSCYPSAPPSIVRRASGIDRSALLPVGTAARSSGSGHRISG